MGILLSLPVGADDLRRERDRRCAGERKAARGSSAEAVPNEERRVQRATGLMPVVWASRPASSRSLAILRLNGIAQQQRHGKMAEHVGHAEGMLDDAQRFARK